MRWLNPKGGFSKESRNSVLYIQNPQATFSRVEIWTGTRCFLPRMGHRYPVEVVVLYVEDLFAVAPLVVERDGILPEGHVQGNCSAIGRCWDFGLFKEFQKEPFVLFQCKVTT
ncbi:hypothetical protein JYT34_01585 [Olleya sp. AH-315-K02]|nr:hypothetical protein [Olleya sp. AH-315-K02]